MVTFVETKEIAWQVAGRTFSLRLIAVEGARTLRLVDPDGQVVEWTAAEAVAVAKALDHLLIHEEPHPPAKPDQEPPENAGKPWTTELDDTLRSFWQGGRTVWQIADAMGRTPGSIASRLARIGLVADREEARSRKVEQTPA